MNIKVTGLGIICAIGNDAPSVLQSLQNEESGVGAMRYLDSIHKELPVGEVKLSDAEMKSMLGVNEDEIISRTTLMGAIALRQALQDAGVNIKGKRVVVISGTTVGGMDVTERYFQQMKTDDQLLSLLDKHDCGASTRDIANLAGLTDAEVVTISTACSSAVNSIILGSEMLKADDADIVIAGGAEGLSKFHLNGFNTLMILDQAQCRPFDKTRTGLNLGEGAAFVVLEKAEHAETSEEKPYIIGYGNRCDAFHQTASSDDGEGAFLAMTDALQMANLQPADIRYINAHGTGTPNNDASESAAIRRVFNNQMPLISSTKGLTGHTTSASGSIETVICLLAMRSHFVPGNYGFTEADENCIIPTKGVNDVELHHVICNSFGFGGNDSSIIISSEPTDPVEKVEEDIAIKQVACVEITDVEQLKDSREFISPMEARRMGKLLKASTLTSLRALKEAGLDCPDAIIAATANGMLEFTEKFLEDIDANNEGLLKPTLFMQSTHNTLSSAIAIRTKCHGYNITYSQGEQSFKWAMRDAERLIRTGKAKSVLVGYHDESTPLFQEFCKRAGKPVPGLIYSKAVVLVGQK
ncbi:MAG: beta-ketoacyl-[acyl-carrier-protein] synthase family protein [Bacteroidales bacterium]|nr:beta-ketoacyl-[acyl-carrier-protein] synthase family protein [Bacteroidales bacterium]